MNGQRKQQWLFSCLLIFGLILKSRKQFFELFGPEWEGKQFFELFSPEWEGKMVLCTFSLILESETVLQTLQSGMGREKFDTRIRNGSPNLQFGMKGKTNRIFFRFQLGNLIQFWEFRIGNIQLWEFRIGNLQEFRIGKET
ncbi:hypothetical protein C1645_822866 [Glomus cerebriforme]|uniref:Uncharacterized protein n=1 Tax=Glomus cerebriforme TaxID=658196 RepID=A0A397T6Z9_9GLOM|nr:hypothetical protein C1645_822866 [Glomus cerebriforme]